MEKNSRPQPARRGFEGAPPRSRHSNTSSQASRHPNFRTRECKYYAKGSCPEGDSCTFKHTIHPSVPDTHSKESNTMHPTGAQRTDLPSKESSQPRHICEHFLTNGTCRFGDHCKYEHIKPNNNDESPKTLLVRLKVLMKSFSRQKNLGKFEEYLDLALKLLDSNERAEAMLLLSVNDIREQSDDTGYQYITHFVESTSLRRHPMFPHSSLNRSNDFDFDRHILPFMKIVVHDAFTQSCVEKTFRYIIKAIYGSDGERGSQFLKRVVALLERKHQACDTESCRTLLQENCFLVSRLLYYLVRYNVDAIGNEDLVKVHTKLKELVSVGVRTPFSARTARYLAETSAYLIPPRIPPLPE